MNSQDSDALFSTMLAQVIKDEEIDKEDRYRALATIAIIVAGAKVGLIIANRKVQTKSITIPLLTPAYAQST